MGMCGDGSAVAWRGMEEDVWGCEGMARLAFAEAVHGPEVGGEDPVDDIGVGDALAH